VQTIDENDVVFVEIRPRQYQVRAVTTGNRTGETVEITSGLRPAERIVTSGAFYLKSESLRSRISGGSSGE
ncbi:MAG TPA: efflux transporter periplasmic adaptor subunit, partial [Candidatus Melainabacteria bacterium]|nr:efflux transporter periplasmic adaptor subunit [Candidatus Melainabacteria bacterium]